MKTPPANLFIDSVKVSGGDGICKCLVCKYVYLKQDSEQCKWCILNNGVDDYYVNEDKK